MPAIEMPVINLSKIIVVVVGSVSKIAAFAMVAIKVEARNTRLGSNRSATMKIALRSVPKIKPACTELVRSDA